MQRRLLLLAGLLALLLSAFFVTRPVVVTGWLAFASPTSTPLDLPDDLDLGDGVDDDSEEEDVDGEDVSMHAAAPILPRFGHTLGLPTVHADAEPGGVHRQPDVPPPRRHT